MHTAAFLERWRVYAEQAISSRGKPGLVDDRGWGGRGHRSPIDQQINNTDDLESPQAIFHDREEMRHAVGGDGAVVQVCRGYRPAGVRAAGLLSGVGFPPHASPGPPDTGGEEVGRASGCVGFASTLHPAGGVSSLDVEHQGFEGEGRGVREFGVHTDVPFPSTAGGISSRYMTY